MKPIKFKEANKELFRPSSMTEEECGSLWVHVDNTQCVSCWKMSFRQRIKALLYGKVWLSVYGQRGTQPPVWLDCDKTVFKS